MANGKQPDYKILIEQPGSDKKIELAAVWTTSKHDIFSVRGKFGNQEIRGIMVRHVPKTPKPEAVATPAASKPAHKPRGQAQQPAT